MHLLTQPWQLALPAVLLAHACLASEEGMIDAGSVALASHSQSAPCDGFVCNMGCCPNGQTSACGPCGMHDSSWLSSVKVGYDGGFVIASQRELDLGVSRFPFVMRLNGWGQLRHTVTDFVPPNRDLNQFQLKRGRLAFSGSAFNPDFSYFVQLDGRSSSGDDVRLLDYYLSYDFGHAQLGLDEDAFVFRTGKYKMPFTMSRWLSGRDFEFADRSVASMYFDVNRSFGWGLYGETDRCRFPIVWETAIFNGLVTGGAETGSSGTLDKNFAYSARIYGYPIGDWGAANLQDFEGHDRLAMRVGCGFAATEIDRAGTTEFNRIRVVDSGETLADILPAEVDRYKVALFAIDASLKFRGCSSTLEYYFRTVDGFRGASVPGLSDHGFWLQLGYFVIPKKWQLITRWSRVVGDSGTLGVTDQSADEVAGGFAWYFRENHAKIVLDVTNLDGAPINSQSLDITPGNRGWLYRSQIQFSF